MILSLRNRHLATHVTLDSCPLVPERGKGTSVRERLGSRGNGNVGWGLFLLSDDMRKLRIALRKQGDGEIMIWCKPCMMLLTIVVSFYPT